MPFSPNISWAPWVKLTQPSVLLPFVVSSWVVHAEEGQHQWAQLTLRYYLSRQYRPAADSLPPSLWWADDAPVQVEWGQNAASSTTWVGYVVAPELLNDPGAEQPYTGAGQYLDVRYTLLGASKPLQTQRTRTWQRCTASYMAEQIGAANRLAAVTDAHPRVFAARQQASESDFRYLQERASEVGYRLTVDGTALYLTDPRRALVSTVPNFTQHRTPGTYDTMRLFKAVVGETDPSGGIRAQQNAVALSPAGVISQAQATAPRIDPVSGQDLPAQVGVLANGVPAQSYADAAAITQAAVLRDLWWVHATATVDGDVRLRPGCVVNLGGDALGTQYQGEWMVRRAHHRVDIALTGSQFSTYYADVELGRDQPTTLTRVTSPVISLPPSQLVAGRWVAA